MSGAIAVVAILLAVGALVTVTIRKVLTTPMPRPKPPEPIAIEPSPEPSRIMTAPPPRPVAAPQPYSYPEDAEQDDFTIGDAFSFGVKALGFTVLAFHAVGDIRKGRFGSAVHLGLTALETMAEEKRPAYPPIGRRSKPIPQATKTELKGWVEVAVRSSGRIEVSGHEITLAQFDALLAELKENGMGVWCYCERAQPEPPIRSQLLDHILNAGIRFKLSEKSISANS